ncbi:phage tail protein [Laspinema olomoucense]|uniref:Phage tail protein n=1 Tax=Laspinema olomoucense D3b TaxID=2953688 RepID=A0ABT2NHY3_9CYAN|nr:MULTISPECIES: phage tail protein [unclassified Laspinema]MCT7980960.1 phage tail protein [Laspinema sp. D3b]MCT7991532.1 phage tail protein [Laspinema sp. D3a]
MTKQNQPETHGLNYITANRFYVEMQESNSIAACFSECSGLSVTVNYDTYFEGGVNNQQRIILGNTQFSEVTLKRGLTNDAAFWGWASRMLTKISPDSAGSPQRRNINILLFNPAGETIQCWTLIGAVPVAWRAPALRADAATVAIEELSLAYEGLNVEVNSNSGGNALGGGGKIHQSGRGAGGFFI